MHVRFIVLYDKLRNSEVLIPYEFEASKITEVLDPEKDFGVEESPLHLIFNAIDTNNTLEAHKDDIISHSFFLYHVLVKSPKLVQKFRV